MPTPDIPDKLRQFIFEHVDSLALLDVLFLLRTQAPTGLNSEQLSKELRTSADSVSHRLAKLAYMGLVRERTPGTKEFCYEPRSPDLAELVTELNEAYKLKPHKILELIFSSTKRARQFADAFSITKPAKPDEGDNG